MMTRNIPFSHPLATQLVAQIRSDLHPFRTVVMSSGHAFTDQHFGRNTNFNKVWDQFDTLGASAANPAVTFANGTTANLLTGPYNFKGFVPTSASQLQNVPLAFVGTDSPRQVSVGLRFSF